MPARLHPHGRRLAPAVLVTLAALAGTACAGAEGQSSPPASSASGIAPSTGAMTTGAPSGAGAGSGSDTSGPSATSPGADVPAADAPSPTVAPLTGEALDPATAGRPAVVVKIDNHPDAPAQSGLNQADVVYEELTEGVTRFAAVFQSRDAALDPADPGVAPVGPVRSARTTDIDLLAPLARPRLVWSGGNAGVQRAVADAVEREELVDIVDGVHFEAGFTRAGRARAPHNLYADLRAIYQAFRTDDDRPPPPLFTYRPLGAPASAGAPVGGVRLTFDKTRVQWQWDVDSATWLRVQYGDLHVDAEGEVIDPANVVVMFVDYQPSPADPRSPEAVTVGEGEAWVFTDGRVVTGTWSRPDRAGPAELRDAAGAPIALTPGRTWVELAPAGMAVTVPPGVAMDTVAYP